MPQRLDVSPIARPDDRYAVVVSKYNSDITDRLCEAAVTTLGQHGVSDERIVVVPVPGSFEIPVVAEQLARSGHYDAIVCLGAVIQGETTHDQYINHQVSASLGQLALEQDLPVLFGVLTCQTLEQALNRAGGSMGNKGVEAAQAALEMMGLFEELK